MLKAKIWPVLHKLFHNPGNLLVVLVGVIVGIYGIAGFVWSFAAANHITKGVFSDIGAPGVAFVIAIGIIGVSSFIIYWGVSPFLEHRKPNRGINSSAKPMICPSCNNDYDASWKVCLSCGTTLTKRT
jgi:amino acid transporter